MSEKAKKWHHVGAAVVLALILVGFAVAFSAPAGTCTVGGAAQDVGVGPIVPAIADRLVSPDGSPDPALYVDNDGNIIVVSGKISTTLLKLNNGDAGAGRVLISDADGDASWTDVYTTAYIAGSWHITGNVGTSAVDNFIGTTDNVAFCVRVNNARAMKIEPNATSPNLIGGYSANSVSSGKYGNFIGGGGTSTWGAYSDCQNRIQEDFGVIGGGLKNIISGDYSVICGGTHNTVSAGGYNFIGGGTGCSISHSSGYAVVAGGYGNASEANYTFTGGGSGNTASGQFSVVAGGGHNEAGGLESGVLGGRYNTTEGYYSWIGGGLTNTIHSAGTYSIILGGHDSVITGSYSLAAGRFVHIPHTGAFAWADSTASTYTSHGDDTFNVRAGGGVFLDGDVTISDTLNLCCSTYALTGAQTLTPTLTNYVLDPTAALTLTLGAGSCGDELRLTNVSSYSVVVVDTGATSGGGNRTLGQYDTIEFMYVDDRWVETGFSDNS
ncbi:MAG: hypothetical protein JXA14_26055 [Anaerolineae bacterium]|nr:hypothetical protein [Anaerolineae bacterium]